MKRRVPLKMVAGALRNYLSPVLFRENPQALSAIFFLLLMPLMMFSFRPVLLHEGVAKLIHRQSSAMFPWWMLTWMLPSCLGHHYWRQVRSSLAPATPGFVQAAFYAICTMLVSVLLLLALPFITFGVPALGTLALSCVGMVFGTVMGATRQTGQTDRMRWLRAVLLLPFMLAGLIPGVNAKLVFAPAPVAGTVLLAAGFLIVTGLRFRPAMAAAQDLALEDLHDAAAERGLKTRFCKFFIFLRSLMVWRPWFMPLNPLPVAFAVQVAPVGSLVLLSLQCGVFIVLMPAFACVFSGEHFLRALREQAPTSLALSFAISLMAGGQWLIKREDWPVLFSIGRYGGRQNFTRSMFAAFRINILQTGLSNIVIVVTVGRLLGVLPAGQVVPAAMVLFGLFFGGSYAPALPLLWKEFGGKGYLVAFNLAGYLALLLTAELMVFGARVWPVAYVLAAGFFLAGVFVSVLAPRQLAEMDWPVETEPGWDD